MPIWKTIISRSPSTFRVGTRQSPFRLLYGANNMVMGSETSYIPYERELTLVHFKIFFIRNDLTHTILYSLGSFLFQAGYCLHRVALWLKQYCFLNYCAGEFVFNATKNCLISI